MASSSVGSHRVEPKSAPLRLTCMQPLGPRMGRNPNRHGQLVVVIARRSPLTVRLPSATTRWGEWPMRGFRRMLLGVSAMVCASLLLPTASAYAVGCARYPNKYAHQVAGKGYRGQYGNFYTYNPTVVNYTTAFAVNHLYSDATTQYGYSEMEVGYYKGYGPGFVAGVPHYYFAYIDPISNYNEYDQTATPTIGSTRLYEIQYTQPGPLKGGDPSYTWDAYVATLSAWIGEVSIVGLRPGQPLAGSEIAQAAGSGTQSLTRGTPAFQLKDANDVWHDWTPTYMTSNSDSTTTCADSGFTFTENSNYQDFTGGGSVP